MLGSCVILSFLSFFIHILFQPVVAFTGAILFLTIIDYVLLFFIKGGIMAVRIMSPRFSIGDENRVTLSLSNSYPFKITGLLIEELPFQFQVRNFRLRVTIGYRSRENVSYTLRPLTRGEFNFGYLIRFTGSPIGFLRRRFKTATPA